MNRFKHQFEIVVSIDQDMEVEELHRAWRLPSAVTTYYHENRSHTELERRIVDKHQALAEEVEDESVRCPGTPSVSGENTVEPPIRSTTCHRSRKRVDESPVKRPSNLDGRCSSEILTPSRQNLNGKVPNMHKSCDKR